MDEKWDIFKHHHHLFFIRSLNGLPCFKAQITKCGPVGDHLQLELGDIYYTSDLEETKDTQFVVRMIDFLVKTHVVGDTSAVAPLPADLLNESDQTITQYISKIYGLHAKSATFENVSNKP